MTLPTKEIITEPSAGCKNVCLCNAKTEIETSFNNTRKSAMYVASKILTYYQNM